MIKIGKLYACEEFDRYVFCYGTQDVYFKCIEIDTGAKMIFNSFGQSLNGRYKITHEVNISEKSDLNSILESIAKEYSADYFVKESITISNKPETTESGTKHDSGKRAWWYMSNFIQEFGEIIDVLEYGDKKYPADDGCNWRNVKDAQRRYVSALMRHFAAYMSGETHDTESGKSHLSHLATNALFLLWFQNQQKL